MTGTSRKVLIDYPSANKYKVLIAGVKVISSNVCVKFYCVLSRSTWMQNSLK